MTATTPVRLALATLMVLTGVAATTTLTTTPEHRTVVQADACTTTLAACAPTPPVPLDRPRDRPVVIGEDDSTVTVRWEIAQAYTAAWDEVIAR
ncbi:hypothetical protein HZD78_21485 [Mycobacteroides chelonae]|uniref:hypothetical protein n=1 Tax=Mycobacteroides chelonae TaxID=1774 RepID=UPI001C4958F0|nr:hypothetical protein [Mycobacteroides chelonae]MBV6362527.1 hypothetical protein [Mycobacteroides chelonae]